MNSLSAGGCRVAELPNTPGSAPMLVDRRHAGRALGVSPTTIDNLRLSGKLKSLKIGARRLFDVADLRAFIETQKGVK